VLRRIEKQAAGPLDVLDLGCGNCWLSHRVAARGHRVVGIDIFNDERDGLRAARHYPSSFRVIEADFDDLPLPDGRFDLAIFNASFHYSVDYFRTLSELRRCLRPSGCFAILDTPFYRHKSDGTRMVEEKHSVFLRQYGFASDVLPSCEFVDPATLDALRKHLQIDWQIVKPWLGWRWHSRPIKAFLRRRRSPSKFWILLGRFQSR
jgi:SAM-dependent methyltransferase